MAPPPSPSTLPPALGDIACPSLSPPSQRHGRARMHINPPGLRQSASRCRLVGVPPQPGRLPPPSLHTPPGPVLSCHCRQRLPGKGAGGEYLASMPGQRWRKGRGRGGKAEGDGGLSLLPLLQRGRAASLSGSCPGEQSRARESGEQWRSAHFLPASPINIQPLRPPPPPQEIHGTSLHPHPISSYPVLSYLMPSGPLWSPLSLSLCLSLHSSPPLSCSSFSLLPFSPSVLA